MTALEMDLLQYFVIDTSGAQQYPIAAFCVQESGERFIAQFIEVGVTCYKLVLIDGSPA
jgi:hypothetical protein